jgi:hypothetical protein
LLEYFTTEGVAKGEIVIVVAPEDMR